MVKAVVATGPDVPPRVRDIELPPVGPGDVRVRVAAAGVCHSDLSMVNGTLAPAFPLVLGHEAAGTVAEAGADVTRVRPGDHVVLNWAAACGECWFCGEGEPWLCGAAEGAVSPPSGATLDGAALHACMGVGGFAEELVVAERSVVPLPASAPLDLSALLGCAVLTGIGAVRGTAGVRAGQSVLVIGLGGIGLSAVMGARLAGAATIIAVDRGTEKEGLAKAAGATHYLEGDPKLAKQVRALTGGRGADHAFECVGKADLIRTAWQSVRRGGQCTVVGVGSRDDSVRFNALELFHFNRRLTSSVYGSSVPDRDVPLLVREIEAGRLDLSTLVTHRIGLDGVPAAFDRMRDGRGARSLIEIGP
ncbi:Zn-dependent alcohol dehydrogenase [Actinomadura decatromicini]|uniref:Zn-dependent alcohol dehydrogenase n=1 Tax=Actinomadura decatromicini TaxID=2604572 RepID=A0A5D3FI74_9ACTN|nr:Zn-dependent alcohol dehydrogenase [Actinomadura decatromicini]TYK47931.1 Zn-dependent alcohol dehydrogenase [Actinomadura decatromicini]